MGSSIVNRFATMVLLVGFVAQLSVAVPRVRLPAAVVEEVGPSEELASKIVATPLKSSAHAPSSNSVNVRKNSSATQQPEVFYIAGIPHPYMWVKEEGAAACQRLGAQLATRAQLEEAWDNGASWCASGWLLDVKGGWYPNAIEGHMKGCGGGLHKVHGPWNTPTHFGANCFGVKPVGSDDPTLDIRGFNRFLWNAVDRTNNCKHTLDGLICTDYQ